VASAFFVHPDGAEVLKRTLVPTFSFDSRFLATLTAVLGTTISPYLFFWQSDQEIEEDKRIGRTRIVDREGTSEKGLKHRAWNVTIGMLFSNLVMYFIILTTAATLFKAGKTDLSRQPMQLKPCDRWPATAHVYCLR
jgi:Mn2+/Fe2+ NRAMP family transporter